MTPSRFFGGPPSLSQRPQATIINPLKSGSDDQAKVYLNGKQVFERANAHSLEKDADITEVTLQKGLNVVVVKVINENVDWAFCLRFTDKYDNPLTKLKAETKLK